MTPERIEELVALALSDLGEEPESVRSAIITAINETKEEDAEICVRNGTHSAAKLILASKIKETP